MRFLVTLVLLCIFGTLYAQDYTLSLEISHLNKRKGHLHLGIFNNKKDFLKKGREYATLKVPVSDSIVYMEFQLDSGIYAISLFHDINDDGSCNKTRLGIPTEPYGFSNNIRPKTPLASFKRASFVFKQSCTLQILLHHSKKNKP